MILYHFCPAHALRGIEAQGLTLGEYCVMQDAWHTRRIKRCQWLTMEPNPFKQSWAFEKNQPFRRTRYRLTIDIPSKHLRKLFDARLFTEIVASSQREQIAMWEGCGDWYVFKGKIPPVWIKEIQAMPTASEERKCAHGESKDKCDA